MGSEKMVPSPRLGSGSERLLPGRERVSDESRTDAVLWLIYVKMDAVQ